MAAFIHNFMNYIILGGLISLISLWVGGSFLMIFYESRHLVKEKVTSPTATFIIMLLVYLVLIVVMGYIASRIV